MLGHTRRFSKSKFVRNVIIVATGAVGAQAITIMFAPIITRIYGPEEFGLLGAFMAIVAVLTPVAALSYPIAIVLPADDADAKTLARLSAYTAFCFSALVALLLLLTKDQLLDLLNLEAIGALIFLIPLVMFLAGVQQIIQQWVIRSKKFKISAKAGVAHSLVINSMKTGLGWVYPMGAGLVLLTALGYFLHVTLLWIGVRREEGVGSAEADKNVDAPAIRALASRYIDFPLYRAPEAFLGALSNSLAVIILGATFGAKSAGFYALAKMTLKLPNALIIKSFGDVYYPEVSMLVNKNKKIARSLIKMTLLLLCFSMAAYSVVILFGDMLYPLIFGEEWAAAGKQAQWLSVWMIFAVATAGVVKAQAVIGLQRQFLFYRVFFIMASALTLYLGSSVFHADVYVVALYSVINSILCLSLIVYIIVKTMQYDRSAN